MAYDEKLAERIDAEVRGWPGLSTARMFGSIGWMLNGNLCVGIWHDSLVVRCGPAEWPKLLRREHVGEFDITGRSLKGWLLVRPAGFVSDADLQRWLGVARVFVRTLPAKAPAAPSRTPASVHPSRARPRAPRGGP